MTKGTSPEGEHLYPAFPYTSYQRMSVNDLRDLFAFLKTLPAVRGRAPEHELSFPFNIRRLIGGWKLLFLDGLPFQPDPQKPDDWNRGAYLVNAPGHCAECHSPRNVLGAIKSSLRFTGGPTPGRQGLGAEHHAVPPEQMVGEGHRRNAGDRHDAGRQGGGPDGGRGAQHRAAHARRPRRDRRLRQVAAAGRRLRAAEAAIMNLFKGIGLKLASALLFAAMSALVRDLGKVAPVGQMVFFRSAFAILPVVVIYACAASSAPRCAPRARSASSAAACSASAACSRISPRWCGCRSPTSPPFPLPRRSLRSRWRR